MEWNLITKTYYCVKYKALCTNFMNLRKNSLGKETFSGGFQNLIAYLVSMYYFFIESC